MRVLLLLLILLSAAVGAAEEVPVFVDEMRRLPPVYGDNSGRWEKVRVYYRGTVTSLRSPSMSDCPCRAAGHLVVDGDVAFFDMEAAVQGNGRTVRCLVRVGGRNWIVPNFHNAFWEIREGTVECLIHRRDAVSRRG